MQQVGPVIESLKKIQRKLPTSGKTTKASRERERPILK